MVHLMDDVLAFGKDREEHDQRLELVLQRPRKAGVTLNKKCIFSSSSVKFLDFLVSGKGIEPDPGKVAAIQALEAPTDVSGVRMMLGMLNQLASFIPDSTAICAPLRELLWKDIEWAWAPNQERSWEELSVVSSTL